ncbi:MAG: CDP-alcohol phosphatidyltransferase family protein [Thermoplasmata archaeon]|nr:CDP-alcohol phosphatidyltransferase family protein [Thermoplasmata archaeon]
MVLDKHRDTADRVLVPMAKRIINVNPDHISAIAIALAAIAGILFYLSGTWYWLLIVAVAVLMASALMDALDGKVAKLTGKASLRGDFLDHVLDRYADIFLILGIMVSGYCNSMIGVLGLTGVLMTSYLGTQAQAVGVARDYSGILGRADRLVLMMLVPLIQWGLIFFWQTNILFTLPYLNFDLTAFDIMLLWFAIAGHATAVQRGRRIWKALTLRLKK